MFNYILVLYKKYLPLTFYLGTPIKLYIKGDSHIKDAKRKREHHKCVIHGNSRLFTYALVFIGNNFS